MNYKMSKKCLITAVCFTAHLSIFFSARRYACVIDAMAPCLSVCLSVSSKRLNGLSYTALEVNLCVYRIRLTVHCSH